MNLERIFTTLAGMIVLAIATLYAFGLEHKLPFYTVPTEIVRAADNPVSTHPQASEDALADRAALAAYQAALPTYVRAPDHEQTSSRANHSPFLTGNTLDVNWISPDPVRARHDRFDQLADRQVLADYMTWLPIYPIEPSPAMQARAATE